MHAVHDPAVMSQDDRVGQVCFEDQRRVLDHLAHRWGLGATVKPVRGVDLADRVERDRLDRHLAGKARCRCKSDPPVLHGPYHHWTRKIDAKTVGRYLSDEQLERYSGWFEEARRLRGLFGELETLSLRIAERTEGWDPQAPPTGYRRRLSTDGPHEQGRR